MYELVSMHISKYILFTLACVVNLKLAFTNWFFYNLMILIKLCKMGYLFLDKALLLARNQVICLKIWKLWRAPTIIKFIIFCWNVAHVSKLTMSTKGCSEFLCFLRSWVIKKNVKNERVETRPFWFLQITHSFTCSCRCTNIKLPQVGLQLVWLLTTRHNFVCFDVTSRVDIDCARPSFCQAR